MTTIAFRENVMAADSAVWLDDLFTHRTRKIFRLKDGSVAGFCGALNDALALIRWLDGNKDEKVNWSEATILVATPSGRMLMYDAEKPVVIRKTKYIAIGTGSAVALGAMFCGGSAVDAVAAACEHDARTKGPVFSMKVNE